MTPCVEIVKTITVVEDTQGRVTVVTNDSIGNHEVMVVGKFCAGFDDIDTGIERIRAAAQALARADRPRLRTNGEPRPAFENQD